MAQLAKGFRVLSLPLTQSENPALHYLYIKEHNDKAFQGRILFVGNVDYRFDMSHEEIDKYLRVIFSRFGDIESVSVSAFTADQLENTRFAHIVFTKKSTLKLALNASESDYELAKTEVLQLFANKLSTKPITIGDIRRKFQLIDVDINELQKDVDEYMREFEEGERREELERKMAQNKVDEDGFITIVGKKKRKLEETNQKLSQRHRKKKKNTELKNFYRYQVREEKMKQLDMLRKKFDEDKERITKMKEARKFNPF